MRPRSVSDIRWQGKTALVRADLNTPLARGDNGAVQVADDARIRAALPTLQRIAQNGGKAVILSHLGRPKGKHRPELSLAPVAEALQNALGEPVSFSPTPLPPTPPPLHPFPLAQSLPLRNPESESEPKPKPQNRRCFVCWKTPALIPASPKTTRNLRKRLREWGMFL